MAKNVFQKKKRIAHLQTFTDDFTKGKNEDESECMDYVSSIIFNMDSSFKSIMSSGYSKLHAERKSGTNDELNNSISSMPASTSRKGVSQNEKKLGKKFTVSRKFPLMEKCKKNLKQIRHNRNISKPRAHLATLPKSPVKAVIEKVPGVKRIKESQKYASGMKNNPDVCSLTLSGKSTLKSNHVHSKNFKKNSCEFSKKIKKAESIASVNLDGYSENEHLYDTDNKLKTNAASEKNSLSDVKDSENETTDSEYERFVQQNKKGLRKKGVKKQKLSASKKITSIKKPKRVSSKNRLKQCNSGKSVSEDYNDYASVSENFRKANGCKKPRISEVCSENRMESSDEESEYDMIADDFTQDPSSESDVESKKTDRTQSLDTEDACSALQKPDSVHDSDTGSDATLPDISVSNKKSTPETSHITVDTVLPQSYEHKSFDAKDACLTLQKPDSVHDSDTGSDATLPDLSVSNIKTTLETPHISFDTVVPQCYLPNTSPSLVNSSSDSRKTEFNYSTSDVVIDLCSDDESEIGVSSELSSVSVQMEGKNTVKGDSIGFTKSDDNCNNTASQNISVDTSNQKKVLIKDAQNVSNLDSEESDIEIIEIVPTKPKVILNVTSNMAECSNSEDSAKEKGHTAESNIGSNISNINSQLVVKTEKLYGTSYATNQNVKVDSNEFKIIEIVPTKPKDTCILNVTSNMLECSNSEHSGKEKGQTVENNIVNNISNRNSQLVVKTENLYGTEDIKILNVRGADSNQFEAAYMTNICNDFDQDKLVSFNQRTLINSECKELPETSSKDVLVDGSVLKKAMKQENESDDEVVMLDIVQTKNISRVSSNKRVKTETPNIIEESLQSVKHSARKILKMEIDNLSQNQCNIPQSTEEVNMNFKNEHGENLSTLKNRLQNKIDPEIKNTSYIMGELKSQDMCSSSSIPHKMFSDIKYKENENCIDLNKVNESHLIELYKKEFDTYQEIVQTEANVSASLKLLEVRQAQKVEHIRSLVHWKRKNSNANSVNKNSRDLHPSCSFPKTDILASSKLDSDIKPNVSKFDTLENVHQSSVVLKQESESSQKCQNLPKVKSNKNQTLKLLNEKCNVCGKEAMAACQRCAKVFFCSNECGRTFWNDGHINECGK